MMKLKIERIPGVYGYNSPWYKFLQDNVGPYGIRWCAGPVLKHDTHWKVWIDGRSLRGAKRVEFLLKFV